MFKCSLLEDVVINNMQCTSIVKIQLTTKKSCHLKIAWNISKNWQLPISDGKLYEKVQISLYFFEGQISLYLNFCLKKKIKYQFSFIIFLTKTNRKVPHHLNVFLCLKITFSYFCSQLDLCFSENLNAISRTQKKSIDVF